MSAHVAKPLSVPDQLLPTKQLHMASAQEHASAKVAAGVSVRSGLHHASTATKELEPHWLAAIEAATD